MVDDELRQLIEGSAAQTREVITRELGGQIERLRAEIQEQLDRRFGEVDRRFAAVDARFDDNRRELGVYMEHIESRFDLLSEAIQMTDDRLTRRIDRLEEHLGLH